MTPLHVAAEKGHFEEIVPYLVDKGTDIDVKDNNGVSLHYWGRSILLEFKVTSTPYIQGDTTSIIPSPWFLKREYINH